MKKWTDVWNLYRQKTSGCCRQSCLDNSLHRLFCQNSTVVYFVHKHVPITKATQEEELLVVSGYLLGMFQHSLVTQSSGCPWSLNPLKTNLWGSKQWDILYTCCKIVNMLHRSLIKHVPEPQDKLQWRSLCYRCIPHSSWCLEQPPHNYGLSGLHAALPGRHLAKLEKHQ